MQIFQYRLFAIACLLLAGVLAACGAPESFESYNQAPSREQLIGRLQSPDDSDELRSFRIRAVTRFTGDIFPFPVITEETPGKITVDADVVVEPHAIHLTMTTPALAGPGVFETVQMIVIDDQIWLGEDEQWLSQEPYLDDMAGYLLDSFTEFSNPIGSLRDSPETSELLREARIVGTEEINGRRTTHFHMSTEANLALMMENFDGPVATPDGEVCGDLDALEGAGRDLRDGEEMDDFFECMGAAALAGMPAPDEYIERFEVDVWVSDDGLVMREQTVIELAYLPMMAALDEGERAPLAIETIFDLYDLNAPIEIAPPDPASLATGIPTP